MEKQWYLSGIKGTTVQTNGAPCIAKLKFVFDVVTDEKFRKNRHENESLQFKYLDSDSDNHYPDGYGSDDSNSMWWEKNCIIHNFFA